MPGARLGLHALTRAPRFYVDAPLQPGGSCVLSEEAAHHAVHVMRLRTGDEVVLFNGRGGEYSGRIAAVEKLRISADVLAHHPVERESALRVTLVQAVSAGDRMDFTVRKATENKSLRITWIDDATNLDVQFYAKGETKCQVTLEHARLKSAKAAEKIDPENLHPENRVLEMIVRDAIARNEVVDDPTVGLTRSEGGTDKAAELTIGMDGTQRFAW